MRHHRELFQLVRKRTGMYFQHETFAVVVGFVTGYDEAYEGGLLSGFREWLIVRSRSGSNLTWPSLVLHAAFPGAASPQDELSTDSHKERQAIETLFDLLDEFDAIRSSRNGLQEIFLAHDQWTKDQLRLE